jgi:hypothetical protein
MYLLVIFCDYCIEILVLSLQQVCCTGATELRGGGNCEKLAYLHPKQATTGESLQGSTKPPFSAQKRAEMS